MRGRTGGLAGEPVGKLKTRPGALNASHPADVLPLGVGGRKPTREYRIRLRSQRSEAIIPEVIAAPRHCLRAWHRALASVALVRE